jgi:signal transduction histidine kinase
MFHFDAKTAYLLAGFLYVLMSSMAWLVMGKGRSRAAGVWCLGGVVLGVGTLLLAFRNGWPGWVSYLLTNAFFYAGALLHIMALRMELGQAPAIRWCLLVLGVLLSGQEYFRLVADSAVLRFCWVLVGMSCLLGWTAQQAWRIHQSEGSVSARLLSHVHGLTALALLLRAARVIFGMTPPDPVTPTWDSALTSLSMFVMSVFGSMAILGLYLERSARRDLEAVAEREQRQASQLFGQQIAHLDRQRGMGELAAAMAHELSQPLTAVSLECGLLKMELKQAQPQVQTLVDGIGKQVDRAAQILHGIRNFMEPTAPQFKPVNLLVVIHEVMQLLQPSLKDHSINISVRTDSVAPWVVGDFVQLSQVVLNMLRNATQAKTPAQHLQIVVSIVPDQDRVRLIIEDDGPGFAPEALAHVGQAFSSTKPGGMGIGISISRRIVQQHGGTLAVDNRANERGAQVVVTLPASQQPPSGAFA